MTPGPRDLALVTEASRMLVEAAGYACSADWTATGPADWFKPEASEAKRAALAAHRTRRFRQSGRPKASRAMSTATAPFSSVLGL